MFDLKNLDINPIHPAHKAQKIINYCRKHNVTKYVETGVYRGATIEKIFEAKKLKQIDVIDCYGIELSKQHAARLEKKYERYVDVHIFHGDTVNELPRVLDIIDEKTLFWLDAHCSGGDTAKGSTDCPILEELKIIAKHKIKEHVLLIDDARAFHVPATPDWPELECVYNAIKKINKDYQIKIENDIIICEL